MVRYSRRSHMIRDGLSENNRVPLNPIDSIDDITFSKKREHYQYINLYQCIFHFQIDFFDTPEGRWWVPRQCPGSSSLKEWRERFGVSIFWTKNGEPVGARIRVSQAYDSLNMLKTRFWSWWQKLRSGSKDISAVDEQGRFVHCWVVSSTLSVDDELDINGTWMGYIANIILRLRCFKDCFWVLSSRPIQCCLARSVRLLFQHKLWRLLDCPSIVSTVKIGLTMPQQWQHFAGAPWQRGLLPCSRHWPALLFEDSNHFLTFASSNLLASPFRMFDIWHCGWVWK